MASNPREERSKGIFWVRSSSEKSLLFSPKAHPPVRNNISFEILGDEVLIIQDKLEAIKARYKDITKLSSDVAKTLEQALQLASQLQSMHKELGGWLDRVEVELLSYETQSLKGEASSQVHERQKVCNCTSPRHLLPRRGGSVRIPDIVVLVGGAWWKQAER